MSLAMGLLAELCLSRVDETDCLYAELTLMRYATPAMSSVLS